MIGRPLPEALAFTAAAAILIFILFVPPPVGIADDGDFNAITRAFDFDVNAPVNDDRWYRYIFLDYRFNQKWHWWSGFPSSEMLLVIPALGINRLVSRPGTFDLRVMGAVHASLFLIAFALFLALVRRAPPLRRIVMSAAAILVFCDVMYVSYYNSFYMDSAALIFLLLTAVFFLRAASADSPTWLDRTALLLSCLLFVTAKFQHSLCGLPIALLFVTRREFKTALLLAAVSIGYFLQAPPDYAALNRYNVIFYGILPSSTDPSGDLLRLGLDESYRSKIGKFAYNPDSGWNDPTFVQTFAVRATMPKLLRYLMTHPGAVWHRITAGLDEAAFQRPRIGNYPQSAGKPPYTQATAFSAWSSLKRWTFAEHTWRYGLYCLLAVALPPWLLARRVRKRREEWVAAGVCLSSMAVLMLLIGCLGDVLDSLRHLFLFNAMLDVLVLAFAGSVLMTARAGCIVRLHVILLSLTRR